jgi:hypothetical protein
MLKLEANLKNPASGRRIAPVDAETVYKIPRERVPDMPDRIICVTTLGFDLKVVTRDPSIPSVEIKAIW